MVPNVAADRVCRMKEFGGGQFTLRTVNVLERSSSQLVISWHQRRTIILRFNFDFQSKPSILHSICLRNGILTYFYLQSAPVVETLAYNLLLEAAMRVQQFRSRNLCLHGSWKWLLSEFADYYGVSDAYTKLRWISCLEGCTCFYTFFCSLISFFKIFNSFHKEDVRYVGGSDWSR